MNILQVIVQLILHQPLNPTKGGAMKRVMFFVFVILTLSVMNMSGEVLAQLDQPIPGDTVVSNTKAMVDTSAIDNYAFESQAIFSWWYNHGNPRKSSINVSMESFSSLIGRKPAFGKQWKGTKSEFKKGRDYHFVFEYAPVTSEKYTWTGGLAGFLTGLAIAGSLQPKDDLKGIGISTIMGCAIGALADQVHNKREMKSPHAAKILVYKEPVYTERERRLYWLCLVAASGIVFLAGNSIM